MFGFYKISCKYMKVDHILIFLYSQVKETF
jgi:hypothetical protein